jgi:tetratricopeptide (TPR) repeat protein
LRSAGFLVVVAAAVLAAPAKGQVPTSTAPSQGLGEARDAFRKGQYSDAIKDYRSILRGNPAAVDARVGLMRALVTTGQYEDAVQAGRDAPNPAAVANATGEALVRLGRLDEADTAFTRAVANADDWSLTADVNLAELMFDRGQIDAAMQRFDRFIDIYNGASGRLSARDLDAVGRAVTYLGRTQPNLFQDALRAFDEAAAADPGWHEPHVRAGNLFLDKYDSPSAQEEYQKVLAENPNDPDALLGLAKAEDFDGDSDPRDVLGKLLQVNPNDVEAHVLLAMRYLTNERHAEAKAEAEKALSVNPQSLLALTVLAGSDMLAGDTVAFHKERAQVLALNPHFADMDASLADLAVQTRRYSEAVERAQAAIALDSASWKAWGLLGMNQLRLGKIDEGRANLEIAFKGDPYNPWFKNSLDLLDTFSRYKIHSTKHFSLFLNGTEDQLLSIYLAPLAEEAYDSLSKRYDVQPELPIRVELYPSHADFSVRALGEAGLGALGVTFGSLVVMDSPSAREQGEYNWASVFWHELSHTFHLAASNNRVPRWFSEGLAVHEQHRAREGWGHQPTIPFIQALAQGRLKKVSELNDGFMHPDYPDQVVFSYYEASLVFQVIEDRWGFPAIRQMLEGYREGKTTDELFESILHTPVQDFDKQFDDYLHQRFESPLRAIAQIGQEPAGDPGLPELQKWAEQHPGDLIGRLRLGAAQLQAGQLDDSEKNFKAALQMFPDYGQADSPYWFLAQIHQKRGELEEAAAALARLNALSESNYKALVMQADVLEQLHRPAESAAALDKAVQVWPYDIPLHQRLATLDASLGRHDKAVLEREAVVALNPPDKAEALYQLAVAQRDSGDATSARRSVLRALEIAPNYDDALELLLDLRSAAGAGNP